MNKEEIIRYVETGRSKVVIVDRLAMSKYPGYIREVVIMQGYAVRVEFNVYNHEYGGIEYYFTYDGYDSIILSLEKYLDKKIDRWQNINRTGFYPDIKEGYDISLSGKLIKYDFVNDNLELPVGYLKKELSGGYWKAVLKGGENYD